MKVDDHNTAMVGGNAIHDSFTEVTSTLSDLYMKSMM